MFTYYLIVISLPFTFPCYTPCYSALEPIIPLESCVISNQTVDSFLIECSLKQLTSLNMNVSSQSSLTGYPSFSSPSSSSSSVNEKFSQLIILSNSSFNPNNMFQVNLNQTYHVQVYHSERNELIINQTRPKPQFLITGLEPETSYLIYAYTANLHTKSDPIKLTVKTVHPAQPKQGKVEIQRKIFSHSLNFFLHR